MCRCSKQDMLILVQFSVKMYRMLLLEGKIRGHPSQFCLEPGTHPNSKRQRSAYSFICFQEVQETWSLSFSHPGEQKVTISIAHNESKGLYLGRLSLMSLVEGWFGSILKSPLVYPFYWHKKYDSVIFVLWKWAHTPSRIWYISLLGASRHPQTRNHWLELKNGNIP